ncbi:membrane protein insertase YidC [Kribbella sp. NBC_01245]|uniref:membrane protein insertase YidC n=1 Tax=Kribbella sp. NBC_01245 TaxID=2903578 RepID=UPI003FA5E2D7
MLSLGLWDSIVDLFNLVMTPLYHAVALLLNGWHKLLSPIFGADSGWAWALSIAGLTIVIRTLLIPLFVKQIRSSRNLQLLQPKMKELQKKYGHDREKLGQEMMKLYKETGTNPFSSCLPLLLQSPIFLALFRVLDGASRGTSHSQFLDGELMQSLRDAKIFGAQISSTFLRAPEVGATNVKIVAIVLILLMTGTMFITQLQLMRKNMPKEALEGQAAQMQKIMLYVFPIFFLIGGFNFPIGVLIYWFVSNVWTMGQQFYVIRRNPAPGTAAFDALQERKREHARKTGQPLDDDPIKIAEEAEERRATVVRQQPKRQPRSARKGTTGSSPVQDSPAPATQNGQPSAGGRPANQPAKKTAQTKKTAGSKNAAQRAAAQKAAAAKKAAQKKSGGQTGARKSDS